MIFEGSEKKVEIFVNKHVNLLEKSQGFWQELVSFANAEILSSITTDKLKAFLLSESSLFVWEDRILVITCGQTTLINAADFFISKVGKENVEQLIFQRKNEYFSHLQPSTFFDDVKILEKNLSGQAYRFGNIDDHHNFIYFLDKEYSPNSDDHTFELLMYDLGRETTRFLTKTDLTTKRVREYLALDKILPGFTLDDHIFKPYGYSLNAIKGDEYLTIHITPQEECPYISIETDMNLKEIMAHILEVLCPGSFDFIEFTPQNKEIAPYNLESFICKTNYQDYLQCGFNMSFTHFYKKNDTLRKPFKLILK